ncbi:MAG: four helix bundle protein [Chthoniobacteraceae bacterium]
MSAQRSLSFCFFIFICFPPMPFAHEKLIVYQRSIEFVAWLEPLLETLPKVAAKDQLDRASTSVPLNIAEGNGKFSNRDRARFFQMAHGSALECAAALDVLVAKRRVARDLAATGKETLEEIVKMMLGLLDRYGCRLAEDETEYRAEQQ